MYQSILRFDFSALRQMYMRGDPAGTRCAACRALYPKLHQIASQNEDVLFLKVDFETNKQVCASLTRGRRLLVERKGGL